MCVPHSRAGEGFQCHAAGRGCAGLGYTHRISSNVSPTFMSWDSHLVAGLAASPGTPQAASQLCTSAKKVFACSSAASIPSCFNSHAGLRCHGIPKEEFTGKWNLKPLLQPGHPTDLASQSSTVSPALTKLYHLKATQDNSIIFLMPTSSQQPQLTRSRNPEEVGGCSSCTFLNQGIPAATEEHYKPNRS